MANSMPTYSLKAGQLALTMPPPFSFPGMTMRVFPLRANMYRLTDFCNRYLNIVPSEVGVFRPASPYVTFAMLNYGKLASAITNMGWVAQNEVIFSVMLEWYKKDPKTGQLVFHDWATCTPFVWVDSMTSLTTGREVYGWPKLAASMAAEVDAWTKSPRERRRVLRLDSMMFQKAFAGQRQQLGTLLEIDKEAEPAVSQMPPRWDNPLNPLYAASRVAKGAMSLASDAYGMLTRPAMSGYTPLSGKGSDTAPELPAQGIGSLPGTASLLAMARKLMGTMNPLAPDLYSNTLNLKQFRDATDPSSIAYQSLNVSKMQFKRINGAGSLGDLSVLGGDPSGGFRLRVHRHDEQPIIDCLGLEVESERTDGGVRVATLKPTMPYWLDLDMSYGIGKTLAWRTRDLGWMSPEGKAYDTAANVERPKFNTTRSAAVAEVSGPFEFPNTTARVLPLMADPERLDSFCRDYLMDGAEDLGPDAEHLSFEAYGSYVYMTIFNFEEQASASMNIGRVSDKKVAFYVPMKVFKGKGKDKKLVSLGMVAPFIYANSNLAAISGREICGFTSVQADIESPRGGWLDTVGPAKPMHGLMSVTTDLMQAIDMGQEVKREPLLHVMSGCHLPNSAEEEWREVAATWGRHLLRDFEQKEELTEVGGASAEALENMRALTLELMGTGDGTDCALNEFSLKQFRDSDQPEKACYQAIVQSRYVLDRLHDMREIEEPLHVAIGRFPSQPIVKILGLRVKHEDLRGAQPIDWIEVQRPFWAHLSLQTTQPREIVARAGAYGWKGIDLSAGDGATDARRWYFEAAAKGSTDTKTRVGRGLCHWIDRQERLLADDIEAGMDKRCNLEEDERKREGTPQDRGSAPIQGLPVPRDFWTDLSAHPSWVPGTILRRRQNLQEALQQWLERAASERFKDAWKGDAAKLAMAKDEPWRLSRADAADAVALIHEPQAIIESILSREWGHRGEPRWLKRYSAVLSTYRKAHELGAQAERGQLKQKLREMRDDGLIEGVPAEKWAMLERQLEDLPTLQLDVLRTLADCQKPFYYIRADSLGPLTEAFAREHKLEQRNGEFYLVKSRSPEEVFWDELIKFLAQGIEQGPVPAIPIQPAKNATK